MRDAVRHLEHVAIRPPAAGEQEGGTLAVALLDVSIEELRGAVELTGVRELAEGAEVHRRPVLERREVGTTERVHVRRVAGGSVRRNDRHHAFSASAMICPAMSSFWISLVPS